MNDTYSLEIKNSSKKFGETVAVNDFSFNFSNGIYGLLGENGAGKTTLIKIICCLLKGDKGHVTFDGKDVLKLDEEYRDILGYLPQSFGYYPHYTVLEFLEYIGILKGLNKSQAKEKSEELIEKVNLGENKNKKMKNLSGGMKRRVGIAQTLLNEPKILMLDEPTAGLDPKERIQFRNLISSLAKDTIILLSTHIVSDISSIADTVIIMKRGNIIKSGSVKEVSSEMKDKVWTCTIDEKELDNMQTKFLVSNIKQDNNGKVELKIISSKIPIEGAKNISPNIEDAYLYHISGEDYTS